MPWLTNRTLDASQTHCATEPPKASGRKRASAASTIVERTSPDATSFGGCRRLSVSRPSPSATEAGAGTRCSRRHHGAVAGDAGRCDDDSAEPEGAAATRLRQSSSSAE